MLDGYEKHLRNEYSKLNYYVIGLEVAIAGFLLSGPTITYLINPFLLRAFWVLLSLAIVLGLIFVWSFIKHTEYAKTLYELNKQISNYDFVLKSKIGHIDLTNTGLLNAYINTLPQNDKLYLTEVNNALVALRVGAQKEYETYLKKQGWTTFGSYKITNLLLRIFRVLTFLILGVIIIFGIIRL